MAGRISALPRTTRDTLLLVAAAAEPTLETLERASPGAEEALRPAIDGELLTYNADRSGSGIH